MAKQTIKRSGKVLFSGLAASFVMFVVIFSGVHILESAPFNIAPSAAFLYNLGIEAQGFSLLLHFSYGTLWAFVLAYTFEDDVTIDKALILSVILWFFMMVVYSPLIGWGLFGFGYAGSLASDHPLFLSSSSLYIVVTLVVHLIYGWVVGYLQREWLST